MNFRKIGSQMGLLGLCLSLVFLSGCAHYRAKPLCKLSVLAPQKQTVSFEYHILDRNDCKYYLDRDVIAKGYQPVHLTIHNNTAKDFSLSLSNFSMPCVPSCEVAELVHTSTVGRAVGYTVAGLLTCIWLLFIPAIVDGVGSDKANKQLDADFGNKSIRNQIIAANSTINGLIFVPRQYFDENFSFSLNDLANNQKIVLSSTHTKQYANGHAQDAPTKRVDDIHDFFKSTQFGITLHTSSERTDREIDTQPVYRLKKALPDYNLFKWDQFYLDPTHRDRIIVLMRLENYQERWIDLYGIDKKFTQII